MMHPKTIALLCVIILCAIRQASAAVDTTLQPQANGADVVRATIRKIHSSCIFPNDFLLLLRIAYVESTFGQDANTFRSDSATGGKGIWQMDSIGFDDTKLVSSSILTQIRQKLGVDWSTMTYASANMNIPLYNALAARLLLYRKPAAIPPGIAAQASYWKTYYNTAAGKGTVEGFIDKVNNMRICNTVGADLLFILDASGSIGSSNFQLMKDVLIKVATDFKIGSDATQIAVVTYESSIRQRINFGQYSTSSSLTSAIRALSYSGGGTNTHLALNLVPDMFQSARALTSGFPRLVIVLTDGASGSPTSTRQAAESLNSLSWLERYAVGMGSGINRAELETIASDCSKLYTISSVSAITGLTDDLYDLACRSSVTLPEPVAGFATISGTLPPGTPRNVRDSAVPHATGRTYALRLTTGRATLYISLSMESPSSAFYDFTARAVPESPGVVFVSSGDLQRRSARRKRDLSSITSSNNSSVLYLSIVPDSDGGTVNYRLETRDGDRRSLYDNSAVGRKPSFNWLIAAIVGTSVVFISF